MRKIVLPVLLLLASGAGAQTAATAATHDPVVLLGDLKLVSHDGKLVYPTLTVEEIIANPPHVTEGFNISRFCISFYMNESMELSNTLCKKGEGYSEEMKEMLRKYAAGLGILYIDDIKALAPDGRTRSLPPIQVNFR